ncbi:MAG: MIP family channel protein [Clostridiales bacterium]|nr:MIP family channel protein [Clostridiales bacterium]
MSNDGFEKYFAEFIGTAVLVFMGCGSAVFLGAAVPGGHLAVAFAFGLSIVAMAYVIGNVSGCHINPAVSLGALLDKRISGKDFVGYVFFQVLGAIAGAALLFAMSRTAGVDLTGTLGSNLAAGAGGTGGALLIEIILTFIFVLTILGVTADSSKTAVAGLVIGLTLTFVHIVGIPLTGTSVNPARSIGPALFSGGQALADLWIFIVAPLIGAALAACVYKVFKGKK